MTARGIRNHNPGNLRHSKDKWQGMAADQTDTDFVQFKSPEYGIRALARLLLNYARRGDDTVGEIISKYAPSNENDTNAYVQAVCDSCGFDSNEVLDLDQCHVMLPLIKAIIKHENGSLPYKDAVILEGMRMAGIYDVKPRSVMKQPAGQAATVATIGGAVAGAGEVARQVREVHEVAQSGADFVGWLVSYGPWVAVALIAAGSAGVLYSLWRKQQRTGV